MKITTLVICMMVFAVAAAPAQSKYELEQAAPTDFFSVVINDVYNAATYTLNIALTVVNQVTTVVISVASVVVQSVAAPIASVINYVQTTYISPSTNFVTLYGVEAIITQFCTYAVPYIPTGSLPAATKYQYCVLAGNEEASKAFNSSWV